MFNNFRVFKIERGVKMDRATLKARLLRNEIVSSAVNSSNLSTWSYNPNISELTILFGRGTTYRYKNVDRDTIVKLINAKSVGKEFRKSIMGKFEYKKEDMQAIIG